MNRMQAASEGKDRYFTGKPCKAGHLSERYVSTGQCVECLKAYSKNHQRTVNNLRAGHLKSATFTGTPDQIQALRDYWSMIGGATVADKVLDVQPPPQDPDWVYQQHVRIHGEAVAKQLHGRK